MSSPDLFRTLDPLSVRLSLRFTGLRLWEATLTFHHEEHGEIPNIGAKGPGDKPSEAISLALAQALQAWNLRPEDYAGALPALDDLIGRIFDPDGLEEFYRRLSGDLFPFDPCPGGTSDLGSDRSIANNQDRGKECQ